MSSNIRRREVAVVVFLFFLEKSRVLDPVKFFVRLRLDVDIGRLGIELVSMPKQTSIGNELQY